MEFTGRAATTAGADDGYRLPDPFTQQGQMTVDALRFELLKEGIRQELIMAELAEQRKLVLEVQRELPLESAGPQCARTGLPLTMLPHQDQDTAPARHHGQHQCIPLSSELCTDDALITRGAAPMPRRRPAKERIKEWYRPPWRDRSGEEDNATLIRVQFSKKRKRSSECSAPNKQRSYEQWTCALCNVHTSSEFAFKEHCAGQRHTSNAVDLEWTKGTSGPKEIATSETYHGMKHNPWNCSVCTVKCSGELDLKNHLKGRRHQENIEALRGESKDIVGNNGFHESESHEKKVPQLVDKNKRPISRRNCSICKVYCTSESDLDSHIRGRRHQKNVRAQSIGDNNTAVA